MAKKYTVKYKGKQYRFTAEEGLDTDALRSTLQSKLGETPQVTTDISAILKPEPTDPSATDEFLTPGIAQLRGKFPEGPETPSPLDLAKSAGRTLLDIREVISLPAKTSKEGLQKIAEIIPAPEVSDEFAAKYPKSATALNIIRGTPKLKAEILAEVAPTFIHPDVILGGKLLKGVGKAATTPAGQEVLGKIGQLTDKYIPTIKRAFTYKFGQPASAVAASEEAAIKTGMEIEEAEVISEKFLKYNAAEQRTIGSYLKGDKVVQLAPEAKQLADNVRAKFTYFGKRLVDLKILDAKTYQANLDKYLPTLYRVKELGKKLGRGGARLGADIARTLKKQNLPPEVREAYGEILEAGYPTVKGLKQLARLTNRFEMFQKMSVDPAVASSKLVEGWTKMRPGKDLGALANKYIHPEVATDLQQLVQTPKTLLGKSFEKWKKVLSAWKFGKVVLSPATHARNMMTNSFWLDVSGVGQGKQAILFPRAVKHLRTKDAMYRAAQRNGLIGTELVGSDIALLETNFKVGAKGIKDTFANAINYGKRVANKAASLYQAEEQAFKLMKFEDNLAKGMVEKAAALEAEQWIFNYSKVPPAVEAARQTIIPFATYFSKAIPQLGKAIIQNPIGVYKYVVFFDALEEVARKRAGISKEDVGLVREQTRGKRLIPLVTPRKDKRLQVLDVNFLTPWGEALQTSEVGLPIPQPFRPSGPPFALYNALLAGYDPFLQRKLYNDSDPTSVKFRNTTDYLGKAMLPNLMPGVKGLKSPFRGGYHFHELMDAIRGEASFPKREAKSIPEALLGTTVGLKTQGVDIERLAEQQAKQKEFTIKEIEQRIAAIAKRVALEEGVSEKEGEEFIEMMIDRLYEEAYKEPKAPFQLRPQIEPLIKEGKKIEVKKGGK